MHRYESYHPKTVSRKLGEYDARRKRQILPSLFQECERFHHRVRSGNHHRSFREPQHLRQFPSGSIGQESQLFFHQFLVCKICCWICPHVRRHRLCTNATESESARKTSSPTKITGEIVTTQIPKTTPVPRDQNTPFRLGKIASTPVDRPIAPLYVVDGKIINENSFHKINPETIEKMKVLKGKEATSKYGAKGKNGVVIVSLKKKK